MPRVVHRERGREEVEVDVLEGLGAGEQFALTSGCNWKHAGRPALERAWRLPPMDKDIPPEWLEDAQAEPEPEDEENGALSVLPTQEAAFPVQMDSQRPELLRVAGYASREEIAFQLLRDAAAAGAFANAFTHEC